MNPIIGRWIGGHDREDNVLVLIACNRANHKNVGLFVAIGGNKGFFVLSTLSFGHFGLRGEAEPFGQHNHGANIQATASAISRNLLHGEVVRNFDDGFKHLIGQNCLR